MKPTTKTPVTIYTAGVFGINQIEATLIETGKRDYAQYRNCPFVNFVPKGKRKAQGSLQTYHPYMIVVLGHDHPKPADCFGPTKVSHYDSGSVESRETRFASFDDRYKTEFDAKMTEYLKDQSVIVDIRHTAGTNVFN